MHAKRLRFAIIALVLGVAWLVPGTAFALGWPDARRGPAMQSVRAQDFNVWLSSLGNSGYLATDSVGEYDVILFGGNFTIANLTGPPGTDYYLAIFDDAGTIVSESNSVGAGTESVSVYVNLSGYEWALYHIGFYAIRGGGYNLSVSMDDPWVVADFKRVAGADRYATAVEASKDSFPTGAASVVVASGAAFPDALSASGLCGVCDAPLLLVPQGELPASVAAEIERLGATEAIIVGGTGAVSAQVQTALDAMPALTGHVTRVAGANRYDTSKRVAQEMSVRTGGALESAYVVSGYGFADALAVSPLAYAGHRPILLTPKEAAHASTLAGLDAAGIDEVTIVGGTGAVSTLAEQQIEAALGTAASRVAGSDRFDTARLVAEAGVAEALVDRTFVGVANGRGFADGLAGGVASAARGGALLLTESWFEPDATSAYVQACHGTASSGRIYGGPQVVFGNTMAMVNTDLFRP